MGKEETAHEKEHPWVMHKLARVLEGWDGYQTSLLHAAAPLTNEQLCWRPAPGHRSGWQENLQPGSNRSDSLEKRTALHDASCKCVEREIVKA
jgi:hypothetical protein